MISTPQQKQVGNILIGKSAKAFLLTSCLVGAA